MKFVVKRLFENCLEDNTKIDTFAILTRKTIKSMNGKLCINVYKGLEMVLAKINKVALAAVIGRESSWIGNKYHHNIIKGNVQEFVESDLALLNEGLEILGNEIQCSLITYSDDREQVIEQIKELRKMVFMPYIYLEVMKVKKTWFDSRMKPRKPGGKVCSFKEDDVLKINMAAMQIANELKSIEFVL